MAFKKSLAAFAVKAAATRRYAFDSITIGSDKAPVLVVRHAGDTNPDYKSQAIKAANEMRARSASNAVTAARIDADRALDAHMIAYGAVVVAWENVFDEGAPAVCTPEKVEELLLSFLDPEVGRVDLFQQFLSYVRNAENFREAPLPSPDVLGKG